jgi:uncharacterized protein with gpF-like domain
MLFTQSSDRKDMDKQARKEDRQSRELEEQMNRDLAVFFKRVTLDFKQTYSKIGLIPDQEVRYGEALRKLLIKYMKQTSEIFSHTIRNNQEKGLSLFETKAEAVSFPGDENEDVAAIIGAEMALFIVAEADKQAKQILATSEKEMVNDIERANEMQSTSGEFATLTSTANLAAENFGRKTESRAKLISFMAVGVAISQSKQTEAEVLNQSNATIEGIKVAGNIEKNWNALLDSKTRPAHVNADAVYFDNPIPLNESFSVGGEALRFPRDPNGSAGNTINCRCQSHNILSGGG